MILVHRFIKEHGAKVLRCIVVKGKWRQLHPSGPNGAVFIDSSAACGVILNYHV
jgi:hypothetical protein